MDPRIPKLADVLVNHSLKVKKGDKVIIASGDFTAMELLMECYKLCLSKGAHAHIDICNLHLHQSRSDAGGILPMLLQLGEKEHIQHVPEHVEALLAWANKFLSVICIHDKDYLSGVDPEKLAMWKGKRSEMFDKIVSKDWVLTKWPTKELAEASEMSLEAFTDFYFTACVTDYDLLGKRIQLLQDVLDKGSVVHIVGPGTDLKIGIEGRLARGAEPGQHNVPDGECFIGPVEDKTEGVITFDLPQVYDGHECQGIQLTFEKGEIIHWKVEKGEKFFKALMDAHPGNKRLGELGIGMNDHIQKYSKDILFDEKILGTVHLALGQSYPYERGGGKNKGTIHWDLVKDLRMKGTSVKVDETEIIRDGKVLV